MNRTKHTKKNLLNRRDALKMGLTASALTTLPLQSIAKSDQQGKRPNILFLMADQFRGDCLGADGHPVIKTPNLDRIAAEGVRFRCAYSSTPSCTPARAALLTGLSPWNHGMLGYSRVAEEYPFEKPRVMAKAGYHTMCIGKNHFHPQRNYHGYQSALLDESGREQSVDFRSDYHSWFYSMAPTLSPDSTGIGWNDYRGKPYALPEHLHPTHWTGSSAVRFLKNYNQPKPFMLKVSFARPHSPYDPPERFNKLYENADIPEAHVGEWAKRYAEPSGDNFTIWHGDKGKEQVRRSRQAYYGSISFIDEWIGNILDTLEQKGILENTLIIFLSDHGDMTGDHNMWRKTYAYEPSARVPMMIRWPSSLLSAKRGQVLSQPVELRDVLPTFLDAASITAPDHLDGKSLLQLVRGKTSDWREYIDLEHDLCYSKTNHWTGLTDGHQKYIFHAFDGEEQLFDLDNDPHELNDLSSDPGSQATLLKWRERMINHLSVRGDKWVKNGKLALRPGRMLHSPNYPKTKA